MKKQYEISYMIQTRLLDVYEYDEYLDATEQTSSRII